MLGRPFGVPHDPAFQQRVLLAVLCLLESPAGPTLVDYGEDAPTREVGAQSVACPVNFDDSAGGTDLGAAFVREVVDLLPWHDLARQRRGRTAVGLSGVSVEAATGKLAGLLNGLAIETIDGLSAGESVKLLYEDIRTYYHAAAAARPGNPDAMAIQDWFWNRTAAGKVFIKLSEIFSRSDDKSLQQLCATSLVPKAILMKST